MNFVTIRNVWIGFRRRAEGRKRASNAVRRNQRFPYSELGRVYSQISNLLRSKRIISYQLPQLAPFLIRAIRAKTPQKNARFWPKKRANSPILTRRL